MQKNKKRAYPAFIREDEGMQLVYVLDFAIFTEGHDLVDAIEMARDAIGMTGQSYLASVGPHRTDRRWISDLDL